ncbi:DUF5953 family protein [Myxococcus stipitatus]|uniref:DUF5953 family protein n=1 Tax=Myxococcus stipitatus TaxID=83455 RepID=UPI001F252C42|nr:DUF5953 family protein [Myxococcus stipitatus]MCE9672305.1 DUF5953 family protein [Myxococcus stipitatus]
MAAHNDVLSLVVHAPALVPEEVRPLLLTRAVEEVLHGVVLDWKVTDEGGLVRLDDRGTWLRGRASDGGFPLVCNGDEHHPVMLHGVGLPATSSAGGQPRLAVHMKAPMLATGGRIAGELLERLAEVAGAEWGHATPRRALRNILEQAARPVSGPHRPPGGLPVLQLPVDLASPVIPHHLGWINFWSAATARALGFPDATRDSEWLARAKRTGAGGWVVQLTDTPLDLDTPEHLATLLRAYERFGVVGGRAPPRDT